jgi:putative oxidoreductase
METLYGAIVKIGSNLQSLLLLYMRLTWGHQLFFIGLNKLKHIPDTIQLFTQLNIPYPTFHAYEVGLLENIGGFLLIIGFASRLISIPLIILFITALSTAHKEALTHYKFVTEPFSLVLQQPYPFLMTSLMVFFFGPGRISLDAWLKRWVSHQPRY